MAAGSASQLSHCTEVCMQLGWATVNARNRRMIDKTINSSMVPLEMLNLRWIPYSGETGAFNSHGNARRKRSKAWKFMGQLVRPQNSSEDGDDVEPKLLHCLLSDLLYCRLCFEEQMKDEHGSLSRVYCTATTTSSGNHLSHAASKHGVHFDKNEPAAGEDPAFEDDSWPEVELSVGEHTPSISAVSLGLSAGLDVSRDLVALTCADLLPLSSIEHPGFRAFCEKHTTLTLPSSTTLSTSTLPEMYTTAKARIVEVLESSVGGTVMLDSWSDGTSAPLGRHYLAVRFCFVHDWSFQMVTLGVRPVPNLNASTTAPIVRNAVADFLPSSGRRCTLFTTAPDTEEMRALAAALGGDERIVCVADAMNRLLTGDSLRCVPAITQLLGKCRAVVSAIHFEGYRFDSGRQLQPCEFEMFERLAEVHELLHLDVVSPVAGLPTDENDLRGLMAAMDDILDSSAAALPSRWTVVLATVNAVLDHSRGVREALCRAGCAELCLNDEDVGLLAQLRDFLTPFEQFALLAAECSPNLSLVPLIRTRIQRQCQQAPSDNDQTGPMNEVRRLVAAALDTRLPLTDIVRLSICFDPAVRDVLLARADCEDILTSAYRRLRDSPLADLFPRSTQSASSSPEGLSENGGGPSAAKRLRLSLLHESSTPAGVELREAAATAAAPSDREAADEIRRFLTLHDDAPALEFWKRHGESLPILAVMARLYLAASPGCVPFDRLFSARSLLVNSRLAALPPYRVNMMAFMHDNHNSSLLSVDHDSY